MALTEGQVIGPYKIVEQMGQGGMATIYKAYHARLDRMVAIKVMHQAFLEDQNFLSRFEREAQIVAKLEHPHIVPVYDFAEHEGQPFLVMKYIEGQTLKALNERGALPLEEIVRIMPPIAAALDYAHRQGVLHRDIKPSNIILDNQGTPYLTDFGLARMAQSGESTLSTDMLLGTPHYISPEQAMGRRDLDSRTDLYSLGVVLYELVVGRVPFSADTPFAVIHDHIYRPLPAPSSINPEVPPQVEAVLVKALAKNPADRYSTAAEMVQAFTAAVQSSGLKSLNPDRIHTAEESLAQVRAAQDAAMDDVKTTVEKTPTPTEKPKREERASNRRVEAAIDLNIESAGKAIERVGLQVRDAIESGWGWIGGKDDELAPPHDENALRKRVEKQYKKRQEFNGHLVAYVFVNLLLWIIIFGGRLVGEGDFWAIMDEFPWPLLVSFGWGAGLLAHAVDTYYQTGERAARRLRAIHSEFERLFGERWYETADKGELRKVRHRVEQPFTKRREFASHLGVYVMINLMMWFIYFASNSSNFMRELIGGELQILEFPWPLIVMFGWGIGLAIHAFEVLSSERQERAIEREVERERERLYYEKPKRDQYYDDDEPQGGVRLNSDGEFTDSMIEELESNKRSRRR
ncbi:MAG TPA: protein kinase [Oceanobacillus sp.]|nr:protein kinase [Oceanobacillus sp.]